MNANEFDLDFDFEKEYGFDPPKDDDTKKLDTDFDLRALLESDFNQEAALFNSEYQNDFDYGPEDAEPAEEAAEVPADAEAEEEAEAEVDFEVPEFSVPDAEEDEEAEDEEPEAEETDESEDEESNKPVRQRRSREPKEPKEPSKLLTTATALFASVVALFTPEPPKMGPDGKVRPVSRMRRFKNDMLPLIIAATTLLMILVFVIGATSRAITNFRDNQEALKSSEENAKTQDELEAEGVRLLIERADELAAGYDYDSAIFVLESFSGNKSKYPELDSKLSGYKKAQATLIEHNDPGAIPNLSFHVLIADPARAFTNGTFGGKYNMNFVTVDEFERILEQLYANNFVLVEMENFIAETVTGDTITYSAKPLKLPDGKKPVMITETMVNYFNYMIDSDEDGEPDKGGAGFASRLVVNSLTGKIEAEMVNSAGETVTGAYDLVPILEAFIEKHPDFSYQGARATLAVTGHEGVFGYRINPEVIEKKGQAYYDEQAAGAKKIVDALKAKGYEIACYTYSNTAYGGKSASDIKADIDNWVNEIVPVIGPVDTLVYAQKSDISSTGAYTGGKFNVLEAAGFRYFISNGNKPACTVANNYVRQLRVMVTGTAMAHTAQMYKDYFDAKLVLNTTRGDVPQA